MIDYQEYPNKGNNVSPAVRIGVAFRQGKYYNVNPIHVHITCKICGGKGYIDTDCKDKDHNYYKKKR